MKIAIFTSEHVVEKDVKQTIPSLKAMLRNFKDTGIHVLLPSSSRAGWMAKMMKKEFKLNKFDIEKPDPKKYGSKATWELRKTLIKQADYCIFITKGSDTVLESALSYSQRSDKPCWLIPLD